MNFFSKTKFLVAVIIVQSAIILAIVGTMGYHFFRFEREYRERPRENNQMGRYVAKQLQLTPEQIIQFDSLRHNFHKESDRLMHESRVISKNIMDEITSEKPDIDKLKDLATKFGKLQEEQKHVMIDHLLEIRSKCNTSQQMNFKKLVQRMERHERNERERNRNREGRRRE
ncbi:MAG: periplasmic heavy metal sensor [Bacteroidales bacterium]|nr:periplasmic heavy metal sensor [Bacteroidales bacterium]